MEKRGMRQGSEGRKDRGIAVQQAFISVKELNEAILLRALVRLADYGTATADL